MDCQGCFVLLLLIPESNKDGYSGGLSVHAQRLTQHLLWTKRIVTNSETDGTKAAYLPEAVN